MIQPNIARGYRPGTTPDMRLTASAKTSTHSVAAQTSITNQVSSTVSRGPRRPPRAAKAIPMPGNSANQLTKPHTRSYRRGSTPLRARQALRPPSTSLMALACRAHDERRACVSAAPRRRERQATPDPASTRPTTMTAHAVAGAWTPYAGSVQFSSSGRSVNCHSFHAVKTWMRASCRTRTAPTVAVATAAHLATSPAGPPSRVVGAWSPVMTPSYGQQLRGPGSMLSLEAGRPSRLGAGERGGTRPTSTDRSSRSAGSWFPKVPAAPIASWRAESGVHRSCSGGGRRRRMPRPS